MKTRELFPRFNCLTATIAFVIMLTTALSTQAAGVSRYWSGNGSTAGGNGIWNTTSTTNWGSTATGPFTNAWNNANLDGASFYTASATVTLGEDITLSAIQVVVGGSGATINGGAGPYTLNLVDLAQLDTTLNSRLLRINAQIVGTNGLTTAGTGRITLTNAGNTYTGQTKIQSGCTVVVNKLANVNGTPSSLGAPTNAAEGLIPIGNATLTSTVIYTGTGDTTDRAISIGGGTGATATGGANIQADGSGALVFSATSFNTAVAGSSTLGVNRTLTLQGTNTGNNTIAGIIRNNTGVGGPIQLTKAGTGTWVLAGANTFSGAVSINGGTLGLGHVDALTNVSGITIVSNAILRPTIDGVTVAAPITLGGAGTSSQINAPSSGAAAAVQTFNLNSAISGDGNLIFFGSASANTFGTISLGAQSTYAGKTTLDTAGSANSGQNIFLESAIANALPATTVLTLAGGTGSGTGRTVQYDLNGYDLTIGGLTNVSPVTSTTVGQTARNQRINNLGALATLTISNTVDHVYGYPGLTNTSGVTLVQPRADIRGAVALTKQGPGKQTLLSANTYTGDTTISGGTLALGSFTNAAGTVTVGTINTSPNIIVGTEPGSAAILDVTARGLTIGAAQTLKGHGTVNGAVTNNGTLAPGPSVGTLTLNNDLVLNSASTNLFEVDGATPTNDVVVLGSSVTYGGVLKIVPSGSFTVGQTFPLFSGAGAASASNFGSIEGSAGSGKAFSFTNGVLSVVSSGSVSPATITNSVSGNTLTMTWPAGQNWRLVGQTNSLSTGLDANLSAWFDVPGGIDGSNSITINPANPAVFYRLVNP